MIDQSEVDELVDNKINYGEKLQMSVEVQEAFHDQPLSDEKSLCEKLLKRIKGKPSNVIPTIGNLENWDSNGSSESVNMRFIVCAIYLSVIIMPMTSGW